MEKEGCVFSVKSRNRVYYKTKSRGKKKRFLTSKQGNWYEEEHTVVTSDKNEVSKLVRDKIQSRRVLGKPKYRQKNFGRDIEKQVRGHGFKQQHCYFGH